jgi:hypothetical protein
MQPKLLIQARKEILVTTEELEASALMERLTSPVVNLDEPDRSKGISHHFLPSETPEMNPIDINHVLNTQLPKNWRSQISEVVWK